MGALVASEPLGDGPPEEGSRYRDVFEDHGRRIELEAELVEVDEPRRLVVQLTSGLFESTITQQLEEEAGDTCFSAVIETTYTKLSTRLLGPALTRHAQTQLEADLDRLKELVEGASGPGPATGEA